MLKRLYTAFQLARVGWKSPNSFTVSIFETTAKLTELMLEVADKNEPRMTKLALIVANDNHDLVTVWIGKGASANPYDRIIELRKECDALREELSNLISKQ
jgi:hypothetical protein